LSPLHIILAVSIVHPTTKPPREERASYFAAKLVELVRQLEAPSITLPPIACFTSFSEHWCPAYSSPENIASSVIIFAT